MHLTGELFGIINKQNKKSPITELGFDEEDSVGVGLIGGREVGLRRIGGMDLTRAAAKEVALPRKERNPEFVGS